jgi:hypothetical protein
VAKNCSKANCEENRRLRYVSSMKYHLCLKAFYNAYLLASLLLLVFGVAFMAFARPDDQQLEEQRRRGVVLLHE